MKFTLARVRLDMWGYDPLGAYWGEDRPLYRYSSVDGEVTGHVRAYTRALARQAVRFMYPTAKFYN